MISTGDIKDKNYTILGVVGATVNNQSKADGKGGCGGKTTTEISVDTNSMYQNCITWFSRSVTDH